MALAHHPHHTPSHRFGRVLAQSLVEAAALSLFINMEPQNAVPSQFTLPALLECLPVSWSFRPLLDASTLNSLHCASKALCLTSPKLAEGLKIDLTKQGV